MAVGKEAMDVLTISLHSLKYGTMPFLILFLILLISTPTFSQTPIESPDQLWEVGDRRWTVEEERQFEKWVEETITEDFFIRYRIPTDCADAVYAIRWIYARIAHLPAAATTTDARRIGHWSTDWKHLPTDPEWDKDERFRAALFYLFPRTWTGTLPLDTYPVRISPGSVRPGTLFLVTESHTGIIGHVFFDGSHAHPLQTWESALPVKVQKLSLRYFFSVKPDAKARSGLVRFRWPVLENGEWKYLPPTEHPFYSEEQYSPDFCKGHADFVEAVARRIDPTRDAPVEEMTKVMGTTTRFLRERVPIVLAGYEQCRDGGCPEGSELWEDHNTVGRDQMILSLMDHLTKIIESNRLDKEMVKKMMEAIPINISENRSVTFYHVYQNYPWLSSHPEDSIEARWGLEKCEMIQAQTLSTKNSIAFIERTYRKRDPKYADFSIRQQQQLLGRLNEVWTQSECREVPLKVAKKMRSSPLPEVPVAAPSGPKRCEAILAQTRATKASIAFIERTYRRKDPVYANFSVQQQQLLLERLNEELTRSDCQEPPRIAKKEARPSPPPEVSVEAPRGSKKCEKIRAEIRAANDSIAFIEKTYRKKDPAYADFSIQQQQQILQRLSEASQSDCRELPRTPAKKARK
jgi:hypothetical protein